ncbi:hypothetical protein AALP_AA8G469900 [Arabis alpina]|uniref:Uncharacterized protein n=1 Tax=Arabis alpina TaxID=50452 RepID=A0A087GDX9_ARAAL|nr:hypothetical protein AALP_AA8G469900 [Arabis alpina]
MMDHSEILMAHDSTNKIKHPMFHSLQPVRTLHYREPKPLSPSSHNVRCSRQCRHQRSSHQCPNQILLLAAYCNLTTKEILKPESTSGVIRRKPPSFRHYPYATGSDSGNEGANERRGYKTRS